MQFNESVENGFNLTLPFTETNWDPTGEVSVRLYKILVQCLVIALLTVAATGIVLNSIAFITLLMQPRKVKRRTSELYLIHISLNDLLFSFGLIPQALAMSQKFLIGDAGCKIILGMTHINMHASIFFVTIMTIDRYVAVVHGTQKASFRKWRTRSSIQIQSCSVWCLSFILSLPVWVFSVERKHSTDEGHFSDHPLCAFKYKTHVIALLHCIVRLILCWLIPSLIILSSNIALMLFLRRRAVFRSKTNGPCASNIRLRRQTAVRKVRGYTTTRIVSNGRRIITKISLFVTVIVLICWMPDQIISFYIGLTHETDQSHIRETEMVKHNGDITFSIIVMKYVFKVLLYCTAVINPIIYCFMIRSFQIRLTRLLNIKSARTKGILLDRRIIISSLVGKETSMIPVSNNNAYQHIRRCQTSSDISLPFLSRI